MSWAKSLVEWTEDDTAYLSVVFTWDLPKAHMRAVWLREQGYEVKEVYIELETAVAWGANFVIPTIGMIGNAVFRALVYLGGWKLVSCPYLDLGDVYEDGSRNEVDFEHHIIHAVAMLNSDER